MRIDKFISNNTHFSRTEVRKLIKAERIRCNGKLVSHATFKLAASDTVSLDDSPIQPIGDLYIVLNKPSGYVCANRDSEYPTVIDLMWDSANWVNSRNIELPLDDLQIVGRLDVDTTGMVLITNDGQWNHQITSPSKHCIKRYRVQVAETLSDDLIKKFEQGLLLDGEKKNTLPAQLQIIDSTTCLLDISEGKYHQVKRMFAAVGNRVTALHRESIADFSLPSELELGQFRCLSEEELDAIRLHTHAD